jgi:peptide/nickel transport system permease protein
MEASATLGWREALMLRLTLLRLPFFALTIAVSSVLIFLASEVLPVNVGRNMLGMFAPQQAVDALNHQLGTDLPLVERYGRWIGKAVSGDLGNSTSQHLPVGPLILRRAGNSAVLALAGLSLILPFALVLGTIAGLTAGRAPDRVISLISLILTSTPEFVVGVLLLLVFAVHWRILPGSSALIGAASPLSVPSKLVLPAVTLALVDIGYIARMMRTSMIEVMASPYIRAARLRGYSATRIVFVHALRNALVTPVTVIMMHVNWLIGGIVVIEAIYAYPGLGQLMLSAAAAKDVPVLEAGALLFALVAAITQLLADLLQAWLQPRLRSASA